jgi:hypothetical protein
MLQEIVDEQWQYNGRLQRTMVPKVGGRRARTIMKKRAITISTVEQFVGCED